MKLSFSILILLALMLPDLVKLVVLIEFKINQDYISNELCVSKDQVVNTCKGNCYLSKQLNKVEEPLEKDRVPPPLKEKTELMVLYFSKMKQYSFGEVFITLYPISPSNKFLYHFSIVGGVFHPPKA